MKKKIFILLTLIAIIFISIYIIVPNVISLKAEREITATQKGLHRMLLDSMHVKNWWPGTYTAAGGFIYNGYRYKIIDNNLSLLSVIITGKEEVITTSLFIIPLSKDSLHIEWVGSLPTSYNPAHRIGISLKSRNLLSDMNAVLQKMQSFYSNDENIYGLKIKKELVKDSILITTGAFCKNYPDIKFIYSLIDKLKNHAAANNATQTGYPMLNVETTDSINYHVRVALPISKVLPTSGEILEKRMLGQGNILVTEFKGGNDAANKAFAQIENYANDYQRVPPAIPFYSLITDRLAEPDSSKWITKIYFPVM